MQALLDSGAARAWEGDRERARRALGAARERTLGLTLGLSATALSAQHSALMSPLLWELAHIANYEDQWLLGAQGLTRVGDAKLDQLYDAFAHPRATRPALPLLGPEEVFSYLNAVRARTLEHLEAPRCPALRDGGFFYGLVAQHEQQHVETMLATMQCGGLRPPLSARPSLESGDAGRRARPREVLVPEGRFLLGSAEEPWAYDNERPASEVWLPAFFLDAYLVTNAEYLGFIEAGGYQRASLWSPAGLEHLRAAGLQAPLYWRREGGTWSMERFGARVPLEPDAPVQHVCFYEAEAYARWQGKRLPSEEELERAARYFGVSAPALDGRLGPRAAAGELPCEQLLGEVWQWTTSAFAPYPGFRAFPYREYSEVFFGGGYQVLRGGSWATHPDALRPGFRNWDFPVRRQIFSGFRCARDSNPRGATR